MKRMIKASSENFNIEKDVVIEVYVDGDFMGYVIEILHRSSSIGWKGRSVIFETSDIDDAKRFPSEQEANDQLYNKLRNKIRVYDYDSDEAYDYQEGITEEAAGQLNKSTSSKIGVPTYNAREITFNIVEV